LDPTLQTADGIDSATLTYAALPGTHATLADDGAGSVVVNYNEDGGYLLPDGEISMKPDDVRNLALNKAAELRLGAAPAHNQVDWLLKILDMARKPRPTEKGRTVIGE
jgi:hypothetical protein